LSEAQGRLLRAPLEAARRHLDRGASAAARVALYAFAFLVQAFDVADLITDAEADALLEEALALIAAL
jgi:hypothetical protein